MEELPMTAHNLQTPSALAIIAMGDIQHAAQSFEGGETNVFDALDSIILVVEAYQEAIRSQPRREAA